MQINFHRQFGVAITHVGYWILPFEIDVFKTFEVEVSIPNHIFLCYSYSKSLFERIFGCDRKYKIGIISRLNFFFALPIFVYFIGYSLFLLIKNILKSLQTIYRHIHRTVYFYESNDSLIGQLNFLELNIIHFSVDKNARHRRIIF